MPDRKKDATAREPDRDRLEYIADLILELKDMARDQRLSTLAGILDVAYAEARLRCRDAA